MRASLIYFRRGLQAASRAFQILEVRIPAIVRAGTLQNCESSEKTTLKSAFCLALALGLGAATWQKSSCEVSKVSKPPFEGDVKLSFAFEMPGAVSKMTAGTCIHLLFFSFLLQNSAEIQEHLFKPGLAISNRLLWHIILAFSAYELSENVGAQLLDGSKGEDFACLE